MKKILLTFSIVILCISLAGCVGMSPDGPKKLTLGEKSYKTGFYGTMFPNKYELSDEKLEVDGIVLNRINHEFFELYHADIGSYTEGTIYCSEKDYENALSFIMILKIIHIIAFSALTPIPKAKKESN